MPFLVPFVGSYVTFWKLSIFLYILCFFRNSMYFKNCIFSVSTVRILISAPGVFWKLYVFWKFCTFSKTFAWSPEHFQESLYSFLKLSLFFLYIFWLLFSHSEDFVLLLETRYFFCKPEKVQPVFFHIYLKPLYVFLKLWLFFENVYFLWNCTFSKSSVLFGVLYLFRKLCTLDQICVLTENYFP